VSERRRRWGVLLSPRLRLRFGGRLTACGKGVVLALGLALLAGTAGGGFALGFWPNPFDRHHGQQAPEQRWGSAAGQGHVVGSSGNRTIPKTLRAKYPLRSPAVPAAKRNRAWVAEPPSVAKPAKGFDAKTSREVPAWRGSHQRGYVNADGTQTSAFSSSPVNYWNRQSGAWAPIDTRLRHAGETGWRNTADAVDVRLAERADAPQLARLAFDERHAVDFSLAGARAVSGHVEGSAVTYRDVLAGGVDVRLESAPGGVKETLVFALAGRAASVCVPACSDRFERTAGGWAGGAHR
jgi:hypothetical protein